MGMAHCSVVSGHPLNDQVLCLMYRGHPLHDQVLCVVYRGLVKPVVNNKGDRDW